MYPMKPPLTMIVTQTIPHMSKAVCGLAVVFVGDLEVI